MAEARLSVRVDGDIKEQAEEVFQRLGMTLSTGVNTFLNRVVMTKGIPFPLTLDPSSRRNEKVALVEHRAQQVVREAVSAHQGVNVPVAMYDTEKGLPYLLHSDGTRQYDL